MPTKNFVCPGLVPIQLFSVAPTKIGHSNVKQMANENVGGGAMWEEIWCTEPQVPLGIKLICCLLARVEALENNQRSQHASYFPPKNVFLAKTLNHHFCNTGWIARVGSKKGDPTVQLGNPQCHDNSNERTSTQWRRWRTSRSQNMILWQLHKWSLACL